LPPPPETIEAGPSIEQPSANHFWVPGHWHWVDTRYAWRPGYWSRIHPDWVWIPAHYVWCPSGYVFVDGYWDYPVVRRGLLFAPAYFQPVVYRRPYYFTPSIVWSTHLLTDHLWVRPSYYHYYFGDFYHDRYANWGIRPWYLSFTFGNTSYDPLFSYYRWRNRDRDWTAHVHDRHDYYRRNADRRPPRTYRDLQQVVARGGNRDALRELTVAAPITQIVNNTTINNVTAGAIKANFDTPFRFDRMAQAERRQAARQAQELRGVVRQRRQIETRDNVARVEGGKREGAKAGEDTRARKAAPRKLNIGEVAQAIEATPNRRGRGATNRTQPDQQAARRAAEQESGRGKDRGARLRGEQEDATGSARTRPRPNRATEKSEPEIARPDRGPSLGRPDATRGEVTGADAARPRRAQTEDNARPDVATPDRRPDVQGPDVAPGLRTRPPEADAKVRDRAKSLEERVRDVAPSDAARPDARSERPTPRGRRTDRPQVPTLPGDGPDLRSPDGPTFSPRPRDIEPRPQRGTEPPQRSGRTRGGIDPGAGRPRPQSTLPGMDDPSTTMRLPQTFGREPNNLPNRGRVPAARGAGPSPGPDLSGMARPPQSRGRADGNNQVAPLRLGGPQPTPRTAATPRVDPRALESRSEPRAQRTPQPRAERRPEPRVERSAPRPEGSSARPPSAESRAKRRSDEAKREKERD
jgi:hypothetical protein